jgi:pancreatic triacylglycerol lipase
MNDFHNKNLTTAHIAGFVGKHTNGELDTIIGLDPAGPLFSERRPEGRINATDARYVECLHTNGGLIGAGIGTAICDADFFPNGGSSQPGCFFNTCSHNRAVALYVESIIDSSFHATRCTTERDASRENCNAGTGFWFGGEPSNSRNRLSGIFHFSTNRNAPFAQGPKRP